MNYDYMKNYFPLFFGKTTCRADVSGMMRDKGDTGT
jgi:hypothetical protein